MEISGSDFLLDDCDPFLGDSDDLFRGVQEDFLSTGMPPSGDTFQVMQLDTDEAERNAPNRKRRVAGAEEDRLPPQDMAVAAGRLEAVEVEMETFLVYRPEKGQPMRARDELIRLTQICKSQSGIVDQLRQRQFMLAQGAGQDLINQLQVEVPAIGLQLNQMLKSVLAMYDRYLLDPVELFQVRFLTIQFRVLCAHVGALQQELVWVVQGRPCDNMGRYPFLGQILMRDGLGIGVGFKGKAFEVPFVMEVIAGVLVDVKVAGDMQASLVSKDMEFDGPTMDHNVSPVDAVKRQTVFEHLRPIVSARMGMCSVKFEVPLSVGGGKPISFCSEMSDPILIITHDSQWLEAEGKMLKVEGFRDQKMAPWQRLANVIHLRYLRITRQDVKNPARRLTLSDLHYFYHRFFMSTSVNAAKFDRFLAWFMSVLQQLRFKRHVRPMWQQGLIFGFIDKEKCNRTLAAFDEGTFLLRFSESSPGLFAVAYVSDDAHERVKHYLVKTEDIASMSLADFIRAKPQWIHLLALDASGGLRRQNKNLMLREFLSPDAHKQSGGYVLL